MILLATAQFVTRLYSFHRKGQELMVKVSGSLSLFAITGSLLKLHTSNTHKHTLTYTYTHTHTHSATHSATHSFTTHSAHPLVMFVTH